MYFTDEEKEIIKKIAKKNRYSINNFVNEKFLSYIEQGKLNNREVICCDAYMMSSGANYMHEPIYISEHDDVYSLNDLGKEKIDIFIKLWNLLEEFNYIVSVNVSREKYKNNVKYLCEKHKNGNFYINILLIKEYEKYCYQEMLVIKNTLDQFIKDDFKTKDEIHMEKAINSADKSFKVSLWIAGISIFLSILSISVSVLAMVKESEVKIKNLNDIKIEKLEKQLEITNKELGNIKGLLDQKKKM